MTAVLIAVVLCVCFSSCHSSKKNNRKDDVKVETIKIGKLHGKEKKIVEEAMSWIGTPYRYACGEKGKGTDCSGMVLRIYQDVAGLKLPRNSAKQAEFCKKIGKKSVKPGDLVFFATGKNSGKISHVGIMIDGIRFVHASSRKGVIISDMTTPYYQRTFIMYGRVPK